MSTSISLRSPESAIASLPYLMGFTPTRSVITIGITTDADGHRVVGLVSRTDLPEAGTDLADYAASIVAPFTRNSIATAVVFAVVDDTDPIAAITAQGAAPWADLSYELEEAGGRAFGEVMDVLYTDNQSYTSYLCDSTACPCANGTSIRQTVRDEVAAEFIATGIAPVGSRDDLAREWTIEAIDPAWQQRIEAICDEVGPKGPGHRELARDPEGRLEEYAAAAQVIAQMATDESVTASVITALARANDNVHRRDALITHLVRATPTQARDVATMARAIAVMMPADYREAACVISAVGQYRAGDGARATCAADQAIAVNPNANLARMVHTAVTAGLSPADFADSMTTLTPEQVMGITPINAPTPAPMPEPAAAIAPAR